MTVVRELITMLGFSVDKADYDKAVKQYEALQGRLSKPPQGPQGTVPKVGQQAEKAAQQTNMLAQALGMVQRFGAQLGISHLLKEYVTLASDANETAGALSQLFGDAAMSQINAWSQNQAAAMGRSQYDLQAYAARLGSVLGPVTKSREEAQKMAESLSELSVDLASFFNTSDQEAMQALRSGLTGEYESLKRFGVVINDATLQEVAHSRGITKKITAMTVAEKTELRYAAIMARTKAAQGDAVRTGQGFANSTKALAAQLKDVGIGMAKNVLPAIEKLVHFARDAVTWFNNMARQSRVLESTFIALAGVAAVLAYPFYSAFVMPALAVGALILLLDELWTTLEGGDTFLRDLANLVFGEKRVTEALKDMEAELEFIKGLDVAGMWEAWGNMADRLGQKIENLVNRMLELAPVIGPFVQAYKALHGKLTEGEAKGRAAGRDVGAPVMTEAEAAAARLAEERAGIKAGVEARDRARKATAHAESQYQVAPNNAWGPTGALYGSWGPAGLVSYSPQGAPIAGGDYGGTPSVNLAAPTIIINGGDTAQVKRVVVETMQDERKKTQAAIGGKGRS